MIATRAGSESSSEKSKVQLRLSKTKSRFLNLQDSSALPELQEVEEDPLELGEQQELLAVQRDLLL